MNLHISKEEADYIAASIYEFNDFLMRSEDDESVKLSPETRSGIILLLRRGIARKILKTIPEIHQYSLFRNLEGISGNKVGFDGTFVSLGKQSMVHEDGSFSVLLHVDKSDRYTRIPSQDNEPIRLTLDSRGDYRDLLRVQGHIIDLLAILENKPIEEEDK